MNHSINFNGKNEQTQRPPVTVADAARIFYLQLVRPMISSQTKSLPATSADGDSHVDEYASSGSSSGSSPAASLRAEGTNSILPAATPIRRRGKSMNRRVGQNGNVFVKPKCKRGRCNHRKGLCPKYGRYWVDVPGQHERVRKVISLGEVTQTRAERNLRDHIRNTKVDSPETLVEVTASTTTFKQQAQWWLDEMRAGRIVSREKRKSVKPATLAGYQAAVNWLNATIGNKQLTDIKNEVAKQLYIRA